METKEKVALSGEQETLLIPLYSKAQASQFFHDPKANQILDSVQYDFLSLKIPQKTVVSLALRARQLDRLTQAFIDEHPNALILHLGCGLDSRCLRVSHPQALWFDLDMPEVIELRRKFFEETGMYRMIASSVTDLRWLEEVPSEGRPTFVVAEGLLMYLSESDVRALIVCLHETFPGSHLAFDSFSKLTADRIRAHPSIQKTGAIVQWGTDNALEIETWATGIQLKEEWFFSQSVDIARLSWFYRFMFGITKGIPAAQKAQRILYYTL